MWVGQLELCGKKIEKERHEDPAPITVKNPGNQLAFLLSVRLVNQESGQELLPLLLEDS